MESEKKRFFDGVCSKSGWMDDDTIKMVYYGLVKHVLDELSTRGYVKLPDFGMFKVRIWKGRTYRGMQGGDRHVGDKTSVNFIASDALSQYVKKRGIVCGDGKK